MLERLDLRAALVAVLLLHLLQVVLHHLLAKLRVAENLLEVGNLTLQLLELGVQLVDAQAGELREAHVDDGFRLQFVEVEALLEVALSVGRSLRSTDDAHYLVDVVAGDNQAFEYMGTLLSLLEVVLCAAYGDVVTVLYEILNALLKREQTRATVDKRNAVDRERRLHGCHLVELVEDDVGVGVALHVDNDTHSLAARLVVDVRDARNLALLNEVGDAGNEVGLVDAVRNLGNDNLVVGIAALDLRLCTHNDASAARLVSLAHALQAIYVRTRREVGRLDVLHESVGVDIGIVNVCTAAVDNLAEVVGRHVGSHTDGDTVATVHKKVRYLCRHNRRLGERIVEVGVHVYSVLLQVVHDVLAHLREAALGVSHGSRRVAVNRTEVTLSVHKHVAHVPALSHTHQSAVDRRVAVRVVLTEHLTNDARTLLVRIAACVADAEHTVEDAAVNRLESVANIREGTSHNHRHTIVDVRLLHLLLNVDFLNSVQINCLIFVH